MSDLVSELRRNASLDKGTGCNFCGPAADEIEALRRALYAAIVGTGDEFYGVTLHHEDSTATVDPEGEHSG